MAGHSHWAGIKHKKGVADQKRGQLFSKLLLAVSIAARTEPNPNFNPRLRTMIQKAKEANVPAENIERALKRASEASEYMEELTFEAYGPGGIALLIEAITDSKNRTVHEVKKILSDHGGKWAEIGSVRWAFEQGVGREKWKAKFPQTLTTEDKTKLDVLLDALLLHDDVQEVFTNASEP